MVDLADQDVTQIPVAVTRQINRIGPASIRRIDGVVADGVVDLNIVADFRSGGQYYIAGDEVGRRRRFDQNRL